MTHIITDFKDGILSLTINRPEKKNALTSAMYQQLYEGFVQASNDPTVRVVLITGAGTDFTGGNDLKDFSTWTEGGRSLDELPVIRLINHIVNFEKPIVAAVKGLAVGFGTTLLFHCDVVIAGESAKFILPFSKLGVVPEFGCSLMFPKAAGKARASHYMLLGEPFGATEALDMGVVSLVCADDQVESNVWHRCQQFTQLPANTLRQIKQLIMPPEERVHLLNVIKTETRLFAEGLNSPEHKAAIETFFKARQK
ncbi:enoyl-CoA hydratase [Anaerolineales bacterium HSG6]|nr:enoyl-CoA hydratase [Anaerolineales bacterium HSG6]